MKRPGWLGRNVLWLGVVSLLTDASSEMVIPLLPMFLTLELGAGAVALGAIEGAAEATASLLKLVSGRISDLTGRRKALVLAGYGLSSVARPLMALAAAPWHVLAVRLADRTGKGLRTSPRDALLAGSVPAGERGAAFGFHRAMDHVGAVIGPALALAVLAVAPGDLRLVFACAAVPGALALLALGAVREEAGKVAGPRPSLGRPPPGLVRFLVPLGLFTLGNASDTFLLLRAGGEEASLTRLPLLWMLFHVVKAAASTPAGRLADRWGRRRTIAVGWAVYAAVYAGFALTDDPAAMVALFVIYGLHHALSEGAEKALVAELAPEGERGTAFGWYHATVGLLALPASLGFGAIWQLASPEAAFLVGAGLACAALAALAALRPSPEAAAGA